MHARESLEVISTGVVCAVGLSSEPAYAAIRANISGYAELDQILGGSGFESVIGAAVPLRPTPKPGQEGARLERLAQLALEECLAGAETDAARVALLLGVAEPHRHSPGAPAALDDLLARLCARFGFSSESRLLPVGNAAAFEGLALARQALAMGRVSACIVGGVDSLLGMHDIQRLEQAYRIHCEDNAHGVVPGEAAAFVAVARSAGSRGSLATVVGCGRGRESEHTCVLSAGHRSGRGLIAAWTSALEDAGAHERDVVLRVSDMTGERYAGMDAMLAVARFFRSVRDGLPILHPAENVGGTGAAAGGLSLAIAALGLSRDLLDGDGLVLCEGSSEDGLRGAALLRAPQRTRSSIESVARPRLPFVLDQHVEDAAFLFAQRAAATHGPHYDLQGLALLDARIRGHLAGVVAAGRAGFERCRAAMASDLGGELTAAAAVAFTSGERDRIEAVLECARERPDAVRPVVAALGFLPWPLIERHVLELLASGDETCALVGVRAAAVHRQPIVAPPRIEPSSSVIAARLRALGELGANQARSAIHQHLTAREPAERFWAAWSAALMRSDRAGPLLMACAESAEPTADRALDLAALALPAAEARRWLTQLMKQSGAQRLALRLAGRLGDPGDLPWVIAQMHESELAKVAGEAFTLITGVDLVEAKLERPETAEGGPSDDPDDEAVALDQDDPLPAPHAVAVEAYWARAPQHFQSGARYLCGSIMSPAAQQAVLRRGTQRQRAFAALAQALTSNGAALFETRAPADRQTRALGMPRFWTI